MTTKLSGQMNKANFRIVLEHLLDTEAYHFEEWLDEEELLEERGLEIIKDMNVTKSEVQNLVDFIKERELEEEHIYYNVLLLLKDYLETE